MFFHPSGGLFKVDSTECPHADFRAKKRRSAVVQRPKTASHKRDVERRFELLPRSELPTVVASPSSKGHATCLVIFLPFTSRSATFKAALKPLYLLAIWYLRQRIAHRSQDKNV